MVQVFDELLHELESGDHHSRGDYLIVAIYISLPSGSCKLVLYKITWTMSLLCGTMSSSVSRVYPFDAHYNAKQVPRYLTHLASVTEVGLLRSIDLPFTLFATSSGSRYYPVFVRIISADIVSWVPSTILLIGDRASSVMTSKGISNADRTPTGTYPQTVVEETFDPVTSERRTWDGTVSERIPDF